MPRHTLSPAEPLRDLRAAAGVSNAALGRARGISQATAHKAEATGDGISLRTLSEYVSAVGGTVVGVVVDLPEDAPDNQS